MAESSKETLELENLQETEEKSTFSTKMVIASSLAIIIFTAGIFAVKVFNYNIDIPDSLIVAWFGFWGTELVSLASIKKDKIKNQK